MIEIKIKKNLITISGHARYDDYGKDIVCASVSSIIYTTVNGIFNIDKNAINFEDKNDIKIKVKNRSKVVDILISNMITLLEELATQYPENITIDKGE